MKREELLNLAKPILFNTEMVKAILDGRKTQTRRVVPEKVLDEYEEYDEWCNNVMCSDIICTREYEKEYFMNRARYEKGDILYVRETWGEVYETEYFREPFTDKPYEAKNIREKIKNFDTLPKTEAGLSRFECPMSKPPRMKYYLYKASDIEYVDDALCWRPSIHMPKEAARIFLKVTDVRAERLQDIDDNGVVAEGLKIGAYFDDLWDSTIKKADRDKYGWNANPWVWVIEFERVEVQQ